MFVAMPLIVFSRVESNTVVVGRPRGGASRLQSAVAAVRLWVATALARRRVDQLHRGAFAPVRVDPDTDDDVEGGAAGTTPNTAGPHAHATTLPDPGAGTAPQADAGSTCLVHPPARGSFERNMPCMVQARCVRSV